MSFNNSPSTSDMRPAWVETGVVANVNVRNMTLDWVSQYTGKQIPDVQWMTPYVHYSNGEGFTCVPEVGALCAMCFPSDDDPPFVLGFLSGPEQEGSDAGDLQAKIEDPGVESEEDLPQSQTTQAGGSTTVTTNPSDASFRAGRPILNPGDMYWQGRNENFVVLRRGGVLQLGSTQICQRVYVPVGNIIRDFCENWELTTAAGTMSWQVKRDTSNPAGDAPSEFELIARENAQDKKATVKLMIGTPRDDKAAKKLPSGENAFVELVIAPEKIDPTSGEVSGKGQFVIRMDKSGNSFIYQTGDRDEEIGGDHNQTIKGAQTIKVTGARKVDALSEEKTLKTTHKISGVSSTESWSGAKVIGASQLLLGGPGATEPAVAGLKLAMWLKTHVHKVPLPSPQTPTLTLEPLTADALPNAILSTKVKVL
jgi:hypothetical protein